MKFREIIRSAKDALYKLLRFFRKGKRKSKHPPIVEGNPENSENQNLKNSPPEESAATKETAPPPKQPQESQTQIPIRDDDENVKSNEPDDPKHKSAAGQTSKDPLPATQVSAETPEPSPQESPGSSSSSDTAKDALPETPPDPSKEETPPPSDPSPSLPSPEKPESQSENGQDKDSKKRPEPVQAGGKRDEDKPIITAENDNREAKPPQPPQCRFVCYEETDRRWVVALAVEAGQDAQSVKQGNNELSANDCRYILENLDDDITVEFQGGHPPKTLKLFQEHKEHKFMVFKMRKDWKGEGQKVKTLSSGDYVVFAHKSCGQRIGKPPEEAAQCRYPDFTAHFFSISENSEKDGFENCSLPFSSAKRFSLKGRSIPDDSDLGELFGNDAPQLDDAEERREISWIVVGKENGGKVLDTFRPEEKTLAEVLSERSGWFFVRIYDDNVDLLHSFPFRRAKGLKDIIVNNQPLGKVAPIVPTENGHTKTIVQFEGDLHVRPADDSNEICKVTENKNTFAVLPSPNNDGTEWILGSGEDCVKVEILLPRIWWKFIKKKGKEGDWQATPIEMERQAFRQAGNEKIRIHFSFRIPKIVVGFGDLNSTDNPTFPTKLSKDQKTCEAELRLDDFADDQAIKKPLSNAMDLRVKLKDSDVVFPIVRIPPDAPPPDDAKPKPSKPKSDVDKSFSIEELKRAKEELDKELEEKAKAALHSGLITNKESLLKNLANYTVTIQDELDLRIISIRVGGKKYQICLNLHRESIQPKNVEKLKAFFKKHFEKE